MSPGHHCDEKEPNTIKTDTSKTKTETDVEEPETSEIKCIKECPRFHKPSKKWCYVECDGNKC